jgi:prepilin signal peptidase PulO-like enzyme (type II secretory pathway)
LTVNTTSKDENYIQETGMSINIPLMSRRWWPQTCQNCMNKKFILIMIMVVSIGCFLIILPPLIFVIHNNNNNNNNKPTMMLTPTTSKCNCYDISAHCCDHTLWRTHKFGTILIGDLFSEYRQRIRNSMFILLCRHPRIQTTTSAKCLIIVTSLWQGTGTMSL